MVACRLLLGRLEHCFAVSVLLLKLADVDEAVLLLVLDKHEFESMSFFLDVIVRLLQFSVKLFILVSPVLFLLEDFSMVLVLVRHVLGFPLQFFQFGIFVFDVAL